MDEYLSNKHKTLGGDNNELFFQMITGLNFALKMHEMFNVEPDKFDELVEKMFQGDIEKKIFNFDDDYDREDALDIILEPFTKLNEFFSISYNDKGISYKITDHALANKFKKFREELEELDAQSETILESTLVSSIASCELFFRNLLAFEVKNLNRAKIRTKQITLEELSSFKEISEVENYFIDQFINEKMYGRFADWLIFIINSNRTDIYTDSLSILIEKVEVSFEIRNSIMHNNGVFNNINMKKLKDNRFNPFKSGQVINLSFSDVSNMLNNIEILCLDFFILYMTKRPILFNDKVMPNVNEVLLFLEQEFAYKYLSLGFVEKANQMYQILYQYLPLFDNKSKVYYLVNYSLVLKNLGLQSDVTEMYDRIEINLESLNSYELFGYYCGKSDFKSAAKLFEDVVESQCSTDDELENEFILLDFLDLPMLSGFMENEQGMELINKVKSKYILSECDMDIDNHSYDAIL
ncbi:MAG: hypothetical protein RR532_07625 [Erysipelothrix sp.]